MEASETVYPSKIDWWIAALIVLAPFVHFPLGIWVLIQGKPLFGILLTFWGLIILVFLLCLCFPCKYVVSEKYLTIRIGLVTDQIGLSQIEEVKGTNTWLAAPALSLDRVEVKLKDGTKRIISPRDKKGFMDRISESISQNAE